jgi:hypothetical protein
MKAFQTRILTAGFNHEFIFVSSEFYPGQKVFNLF